MRLDGPRKEDGYVDPRHCLVIWARPPSAIRELVAWIQNELKTVAPCKYSHTSFVNYSPYPTSHQEIVLTD